MASPPPPDPYIALGVAKDATSAAIKSQYRKLVLKFHPDKVQDEGQKEAASDQFHKIQTAYEVVGEDGRRARYDAQCRLAELRKDVMERGGVTRNGVDIRTAAYKMPTESARGGEFYARGPERSSRVSPQYETQYEPQYEERRPAYAAPTDYFDPQPRSTARKADDYERASKRSSPRDDRKPAKTSAKGAKENERSSRKEKSKRTENDMRRDRDRKFAHVMDEDDESGSESDPNERARIRIREQDEVLRAQAAYYEDVRRQKEEADAGYFNDPRAHKIFSQHSDARDYIDRSRQRPESERRPAPVRSESSKSKVEYIKRSEGRPSVVIRRGSGQPKTTGRDAEPRKSSAREKEGRASIEIVDEPSDREMPREQRRPPTLSQSQSSPEGVRPPFERQRSHSMQDEVKHNQIPQIRRSETVPVSEHPARDSRRKEKDGSKLRSEMNANNAYLTPDATPDPPGRYSYGHKQEYADDEEYATPDGYRTVVREPETRAPEKSTRMRFARSPSPMKEKDLKERERERKRSTSSKYTAPPGIKRTTSTSYPFPSASDARPQPPSRENSSRLFGEVPTTRDRDTRSPRPMNQSRYSPPPESVQYRQEIRSEDIKMQTGYSSRRGASMKDKPTYTRSSSSQHPGYVR